ncbi:MAG TPA: GGDEF domain-containing protein [Polyangiaceae bacterium]|nr:GGDEF domain-containing protein [Polyangiaceae bacterium]
MAENPKGKSRKQPGFGLDREDPTGVPRRPQSEPASYAELDPDEATALVHVGSLGRIELGEEKNRHLLVRVKGAAIGQVFALPDEPCRIGRAPDSTLYVGDDGVSRRHALIVKEGDGYVLIDTNSANGTFVGGERVGKHPLVDGDTIQLCSTAAFRYTVTDVSQENLLQKLFEASVTDGLTGANNREHFDTMLRSELSYARRHKTELSLVLFDIDHFKRVNDTFGHPAGDQVLIQISQAVATMIRSEDMFARYGGEEFALLLRGVALPGAVRLAERVRATIESLLVACEKGSIRVTISAGCAALSELENPVGEALIQAADRRLYIAKNSGRNRVCQTG